MSIPAQTAYPVLVIGAGISGLACAYHLQQAGIPVRLIEADNRPGGLISTAGRDGFRFDLGPQSFLTTEPLLKMIDALGLRDQLQHADPRAPRYILVGGQLVPAPMAPPSLLSTALFSRGTKWRLLTEILRRTKPPAEDESIAAFVRRKFGDELLNRLVAPFVSGVYAGDPERLSLRAAFPKLHEFEAQYGSVLRGAMKSRPAKGTPRAGLCSFRDGMETLPRAIAARLGDSLLLETSVAGVRHGKANGKPWFEVDIARQNHRETLAASAVVVATPTNAASQLLAGLSDRFPTAFSRIEYAPVAVVSACYRRDQIQRPPDGFGFLVPRSEGLRVLGTVFNSSLFAGRAPEGMAIFTSFAGGATDAKLCEMSEEEIAKTVGAEVARVLGITGAPVMTNVHRYARALPQYNLGHMEIVKSLEGLTAAMPGLFLAGNYLSGPSIGSCVEQSNRTADAVRGHLEQIGVPGAGPLKLSAEATNMALPTEKSKTLSPQRAMFPAWAWVAAAALALITGYTIRQMNVQNDQLAQLRKQMKLATMQNQAIQNQLDMDRMVASVMLSADSVQLKLMPKDNNMPAIHAYMHPHMGVAITADQMPSMPSARTLQLWFVPKTGKPVSAAIFHPDASGQIALVAPVTIPKNEIAALAITDEPAGGSPQPTTAIAWIARVN